MWLEETRVLNVFQGFGKCLGALNAYSFLILEEKKNPKLRTGGMAQWMSVC